MGTVREPNSEPTAEETDNLAKYLKKLGLSQVYSDILRHGFATSSP